MPRRRPRRKEPAATPSKKVPPSDRSWTDPEEVKRLRAQVTELERLAAIGQLAMTAARQAWNPLTSLALSIDLLARRTEDADVLARLSRMDAERRRVASFLKDFLELAELRRHGKKPRSIRKAFRP